MMDVMTWLREVRKLDGPLLDHMGVKAVQHPVMGHAAAFQYERDGKKYAAKFRTVDKQFRSTQNVSRGLYNEPALEQMQDQPLVITEGEIDCLSVMQAGFLRAVSLPDGWGEDRAKVAVLDAAREALAAAPMVIVAGDADEAGASLPRTVANVLPGTDVRYCEWPDDCKDPNDVLVKYGEGELAARLNSAKRIDPPGGLVTALSDLPPLPARRVLRIGERPFDFGIAFEQGAVSIWTGIPGSGKSTFLTWAADRVMINEGVRVGIMPFETHPHTLRDQFSMIRTGKPFADLDGQTQARLGEILDKSLRIFHQVPDDDVPFSLGWLEKALRTLSLREGCHMVIIDPWNELEHMPEQGESLTNYINFALAQIRRWARQFDIHIALVAHPKKLHSETGKYRPPTGYDVADSAAFYNKPSLGVTVHQDEDEDGNKSVRIITWKVRETRLYGFEKGQIRCAFDPERQSYKRMEA